MRGRVFKNLYAYRELLKTNVKKEIRGRYKGSFLGILWSFVNPLLQVAIYAIVFPLILRNREEHYVMFLTCGIFPWTWFSASIAQGTQSIRASGAIVQKIYFPREILPISTVTAGLVNFLIQSVLILCLLLLSGIGVSAHFFLFPLVAIVQYFFTLGIVFITSACEVYVRDLEHIVTFFVNLAFYATPIFYSAETALDSPFAWIFKLNPLAAIITGYRNVFMYHKIPDFQALNVVLLESVLLCVVGFAIFRRLEKGFAEEL